MPHLERLTPSIIPHLPKNFIQNASPLIANLQYLRTWVAVSIMPHLIKMSSILPHLQINTIHNASPFWSSIPNASLLLVSIPSASPNKYTVSIMPHLIKTLSIIPHLQIDAIHNASHFWSSIPNTSLMLGINPQYLTALFELSEIPPYPSSILSHHALWMIRNNWDAQRQQQATPKGNRDSHEATAPPITP